MLMVTASPTSLGARQTRGRRRDLGACH